MAMAITYSDTRTVQKVSFAWTSDLYGDAAGTTHKISGLILRVVFVPGAGDDQPSDVYDAVLQDEQDIDVLGGQGANLSNSAASAVSPGVPLKDGTTTSVAQPAVDDELTLTVSNAGDTKSGEVHVYVLRAPGDRRPG